MSFTLIFVFSGKGILIAFILFQIMTVSLKVCIVIVVFTVIPRKHYVAITHDLLAIPTLNYIIELGMGEIKGKSVL